MNSKPRGFTLLEIMVAMAILATVMVSIIVSQTQSISLTDKSREISWHAELAAYKLAALQQDILAKGVSGLKEEDSGNFEEEAFKDYSWRYLVRKIEVPKGRNFELGQTQESRGPVGPGVIKDWLEKSIRIVEFDLLSRDGGKTFFHIQRLLTDASAIPKVSGSKGKKSSGDSKKNENDESKNSKNGDDS